MESSTQDQPETSSTSSGDSRTLDNMDDVYDVPTSHLWSYTPPSTMTEDIGRLDSSRMLWEASIFHATLSSETLSNFEQNEEFLHPQPGLSYSRPNNTGEYDSTIFNESRNLLLQGLEPIPSRASYDYPQTLQDEPLSSLYDQAETLQTPINILTESAGLLTAIPSSGSPVFREADTLSVTAPEGSNVTALQPQISQSVAHSSKRNRLNDSAKRDPLGPRWSCNRIEKNPTGSRKMARQRHDRDKKQLSLRKQNYGETGGLPSLPRGRPSDRGYSCVRCAVRHKKCAGTELVCENCRNSKLYRQLCIPANFKDSRSVERTLYCTRIQPLLHNIETWISLPYSIGQDGSHLAPLTIGISSGFSSVLELDLVAYIPRDNEMLIHNVFRGLDGGTIAPRVQSTPYSIKNGSLSTDKIDQYCDRLALEMAQSDANQSQGRNVFVHHVIMFAANQCAGTERSESGLPGLDLVRLTLRFWAMQAVFFKCPWIIVNGASRVNMSALHISGYWHGKTLLPRLVNQELDQAFEGRMNELEKEILEGLETMIYQSHRECWCAIFLTSFIFLHSLERDSWNMRAWEFETKGRTGRAGGWPLRRDPGTFCDQNRHIAELVVTHFRVVTRGHAAFTLDWNKPLNRELLANNSAARSFVRSIQEDLRNSMSAYSRELRRDTIFRRNDVDSLDHMYTKRLVLERDDE